MNLIVITNKLQIKSMIAKSSGIGAKLKEEALVEATTSLVES